MATFPIQRVPVRRSAPFRPGGARNPLVEWMAKQQVTQVTTRQGQHAAQEMLGRGAIPVEATVGGVKFVSPQRGLIKAQERATLTKEEQLAKLSNLLPMIDFFEEQLSQIPAGRGLPGRIRGVARSAFAPTQMTPGLERVAAFEASLEGSRAQLARAMGDVGNLSEFEQRAVKEMIPRTSDTEGTRQQKLQNLRRFVEIRLVRPLTGSSTVPSPAATTAQPAYQVGQIIRIGAKRYRVTDTTTPTDPDVEEL